MTSFISKLKYAVVGAGAVGGYYGARLAAAGAEVHFLFHSEYDAVRRNGLKVDSVKGDFFIPATDIHAYNDISDMPLCDVVFVTMKTVNNDLIPEMVAQITDAHSLVVLIQNGLMMEPQLQDALQRIMGDNAPAVAGGMAFICSSRIEPAHIGHFDYGSVTIGLYQSENEEHTRQLKKIISDLNHALVPAFFADNLLLKRWEKLVWNIPYNGLCVVLNASTGDLMNNPSSRSLVRDLMIEVVDAANACQVPIENSFVDKMLDFTDKMAPYAPSMKLDYDHHRPMEIQTIYANPIRFARAKSGYFMAKTDMLRQQLEFIQQHCLKS
ncbi:MAG: putative 2-dehydropantoate 2-reductase [Paludibacteraceae bacterium]|nr:putative 2-dehydropantoate 2-reductase [Paludibacteraceae bacterium]